MNLLMQYYTGNWFRTYNLQFKMASYFVHGVFSEQNLSVISKDKFSLLVNIKKHVKFCVNWIQSIGIDQEINSFNYKALWMGLDRSCKRRWFKIKNSYLPALTCSFLTCRCFLWQGTTPTLLKVLVSCWNWLQCVKISLRLVSKSSLNKLV